ncbi:MAG TPA: ROK family protein [Jatrophihabitantaceae bacterium]|jgi:glucokinase
MECVVALDVGGTSMKAALVDDAYRVIASRRIATRREDGPDAVVERILDASADQQAAAVRQGFLVRAAGVVVPGIVDDGVAVFSANLGWRDVPLRELVHKRLGVPVAFEHDVRAGGLAEGQLGAARGAGDYLFMPIGTGIAGAVVIDGRPYSGHGYGGEIGHLIIEPDGPICGCGARGCLEAIASAAAIDREYALRSGRRANGLVSELVVAGDPDARAVWQRAVRALARALQAYVTLLAPELVVIGGGLAGAGDVLMEPLADALDALLTFQRRPRLVRAELGDQAGALGAALLAWRLA